MTSTEMNMIITLLKAILKELQAINATTPPGIQNKEVK